ncbi:MAG: hypothetical protein H0U18_05365 [Pyrinomonadaceae bacterium]|nr:hypothetical protein [Pyrinomonadaceae bacterium]
MTNRYESPEVLKLGKAQDVILDQKQPGMIVDNLGIPWSYDAPSIDDFDE